MLTGRASSTNADDDAGKPRLSVAPPGRRRAREWQSHRATRPVVYPTLWTQPIIFLPRSCVTCWRSNWASVQQDEARSRARSKRPGSRPRAAEHRGAGGSTRVFADPSQGQDSNRRPARTRSGGRTPRGRRLRQDDCVAVRPNRPRHETRPPSRSPAALSANGIERSGSRTCHAHRARHPVRPVVAVPIGVFLA